MDCVCGMMVEWWDLDEVDDRVEWRKVSMRPDPPPPPLEWTKRDDDDVNYSAWLAGKSSS
jgi:hypothetical protein